MRYSYKKALSELTDYAISLGYAVKIAGDKNYTYIDWQKNSLNEPKLIYIQDNKTFEIKTYLMLHELGHHQLRKDWDKFDKLLPVTAYAEKKNHLKRGRKYMRRDSYIVSSLHEEFMAWDEGLKLGLKLGIHINLEKWVEFKSKCLKSYIKYYASFKK